MDEAPRKAERRLTTTSRTLRLNIPRVKTDNASTSSKNNNDIAINRLTPATLTHLRTPSTERHTLWKRRTAKTFDARLRSTGAPSPDSAIAVAP